MLHLNSLSTVGEILLLAVCAAWFASPLSWRQPYFVILFSFAWIIIQAHPFLFPVPRLQYILSWTSKKRSDQVSLLLMSLHKLCKVYSLKPSFLNLEAVKGSKPFFFFFLTVASVFPLLILTRSAAWTLYQNSGSPFLCLQSGRMIDPNALCLLICFVICPSTNIYWLPTVCWALET